MKYCQKQTLILIIVLSQIIISAQMDGIITRRNIEEGETAVVGTMNNPGTVLLTIADMSIIEATVEVDETDIPTVSIGQEASITIDAVPDEIFWGTVTEISNSPIQAASRQSERSSTQELSQQVKSPSSSHIQGHKPHSST